MAAPVPLLNKRLWGPRVTLNQQHWLAWEMPGNAGSCIGTHSQTPPGSLCARDCQSNGLRNTPSLSEPQLSQVRPWGLALSEKRILTAARGRRW